MGITCCCYCVNPVDTFSASDGIALLGVVVNAVLAYWIIRTIQNNLTNKRVLKDHFINEVKEIRNEFKTCLSNLHSGSTAPKNVLPWFKLMNIKINDLMTHISSKYKIDSAILSPYQIDLRELVTNNSEYIAQFSSPSNLNFSDVSKNTFIMFQQQHNHLFNDIIIRINDAS